MVRATETAGDAPVPLIDFESFVRPHLQALATVAVRYVGPDDAADVVQDALLRGWSRWATFDASRGSARSWLVAIVLDQCRRGRLRRKPTPLRLVVDVEQPNTAEPGQRMHVEAALHSLPRRQREAATLHYLADLSVQETAALMHVSEGTVKAALSAARAALRSRLEET